MNLHDVRRPMAYEGLWYMKAYDIGRSMVYKGIYSIGRSMVFPPLFSPNQSIHSMVVYTRRYKLPQNNSANT